MHQTDFIRSRRGDVAIPAALVVDHPSGQLSSWCSVVGSSSPNIQPVFVSCTPYSKNHWAYSASWRVSASGYVARELDSRQHAVECVGEGADGDRLLLCYGSSQFCIDLDESMQWVAIHNLCQLVPHLLLDLYPMASSSQPSIPPVVPQVDNHD